MFWGVPTLKAAAAKQQVQLTISAGNRVHANTCRRGFTKRPKSPSLYSDFGKTPTENPHWLRSQHKVLFNYRQCCLLCGRILTEVSKTRHEVSQVETFRFQDTLQEAINSRTQPDHTQWNEEDLPSRYAIYHRVCFVNFVTSRRKPAEFDSECQKLSKKQRL